MSPASEPGFFVGGYMTDQEMRLRCLELAASLNLPPDEAVKAAKAFLEFLRS